ncbi:MAG: zinc-ribbon domain-containing protein [Christensenellaceae bacterium]
MRHAAARGRKVLLRMRNARRNVCPKCGAKLLENAKFCPECGEKLK